MQAKMNDIEGLDEEDEVSESEQPSDSQDSNPSKEPSTRRNLKNQNILDDLSSDPGKEPLPKETLPPPNTEAKPEEEERLPPLNKEPTGTSPSPSKHPEIMLPKKRKFRPRRLPNSAWETKIKNTRRTQTRETSKLLKTNEETRSRSMSRMSEKSKKNRIAKRGRRKSA